MQTGRLSILLLWAAGCLAQSLPDFKASWIAMPGSPQQDYGVYHFRRSFDLASKPASFIVHVSADNRYQLFANGERVATGPARGDLTHWRFETIDLAQHLKVGRNVLAAVIWNDGAYRAVAQISNRTGFLLDADGPAGELARTSGEWKCTADDAYSPRPPEKDELTGYRAIAANERFNGKAYPWGWERPQFDDSQWKNAEPITRAALRDARDAPNRWMLVPASIPPQEERNQRFRSVRLAEGATVTPAFVKGKGAITVPAGAQASMLLDQGFLTTAYPELVTSGGAGAKIRLRYAESLYLQKGGHGKTTDKGNRNVIAGKKMYGDSDLYLPAGGQKQMYRPLFWRTYRYLRLEIETGDAPLKIDDLRGSFTAYPFVQKASFAVGNPEVNREMQQILATGWRTARLCAHETYMDCPYYEQLQYGGDARIQMMVSLYMTGDARLMKNGISQLNSSRTAEGATFSRAPSALQQYIPPFSLWWIGMLHDYWMYVDDPVFVKQMMPGVRAILDFYNSYQNKGGSLGPMPWWNFVDWVTSWKSGEPPAESDGAGSAALNLQLLLAYNWAADLESALGLPAMGSVYRDRAGNLKTTVVQRDFDSARDLFADQPSHRTYSQQVNTLAALAKLLPDEQLRSVMEKTISDKSLAQSSIYFRAYTNAALREAGLGDRYIEMLGPWRAMLGQGLTTWAETDGPDTRSDCHAWGASPNFELLRTVAGIDSAAPGFRRVSIAPHLGTLKKVEAQMPHPNGEITVRLRRLGKKLAAEVSLPRNVDGEFSWAGEQKALHSGSNRIEVSPREPR